MRSCRTLAVTFQVTLLLTCVLLPNDMHNLKLWRDNEFMEVGWAFGFVYGWAARMTSQTLRPRHHQRAGPQGLPLLYT